MGMRVQTPSGYAFSLFLLVAVCAIGLTLIPIAGAQSRAIAIPSTGDARPMQTVRPVPAMRAPLMQAPHVATPAPAMRQVNRSHSSMRPNHISNGNHRANQNLNCVGGFTRQQLLAPFPSQGFSFEHAQAVNGDLALKAAIDPATQLRIGEASRLTSCGGFSSGGFFFVLPEQVADESDDAPPPPVQPQVIVLQQPAPTPAVTTTQPTVQAAAQPEAQIPDIGSFVIVMRDGNQVKAAAFSRSGDKVIYITPEGSRRSIAVSEVDSEATIRLNGERGTPLQMSL